MRNLLVALFLAVATPAVAAEPACTLTTSSFSIGDLPLRATLRGPVVTKPALSGLLGILGARDPMAATLTLPPSPDEIVPLHFQSPDLTLDAFIEARRAPLRPKTAAIYDQFLIPTHVELVGVARNGVLVRVRASAELELVRPIALPPLPCDALSIERRTVDVSALVPRGREYRQLVGTAIPLAIAPGGLTVATLRPVASSRSAAILEKRGADTRISWEVDDNLVVGWVLSTAIGAPPSDRVARAKGAEAKMADPSERLTCSHDLPLLVEQGDAPAVAVGTIRKSATFDLYDRRSPHATVRPPHISAATGARFVVANAELAACQAADSGLSFGGSLGDFEGFGSSRPKPKPKPKRR